MNLHDIPMRAVPPEPWVEGEKIPWSDPDFSARMLQEHLSQDHNLASRRLPIIERQVAWIHAQLLASRPGKILDIGCGPGLYSHRLARLGHDCMGIDFGPASIDYAKTQAVRDGLACQFQLSDIRSAEFGVGYDLVLFIFGEFNVFHPQDSRTILQKCYTALKPGGKIMLEVHHQDVVQEIGGRTASWSAAPHGLFSPQPHLLLYESFWLADDSVTVERWFVVDIQTGAVSRHSATMQAYTEAGYRELLSGAGFSDIQFLESFSVAPEDSFPELIVITAAK